MDNSTQQLSYATAEEAKQALNTNAESMQQDINKVSTIVAGLLENGTLNLDKVAEELKQADATMHQVCDKYITDTKTYAEFLGQVSSTYSSADTQVAQEMQADSTTGTTQI